MAESPISAAHRRAWNAAVDASARPFADNVAPILAVFAEGAVERAGVRPGARVLDIGCGPGRVSAACALRAGKHGVTVGADESVPALGAAHSFASHHREVARPRFVRAGPTALPFRDQSFDVVVSAFALPLWDPAHEFKEAFRVLHDGGTLSVAHFGSGEMEPMRTVHDLIQRFGSDKPSSTLAKLREVGYTVETYRRNSRDASMLQAVATESGFESTTVSHLKVRQRLWGITNFLDVCLSHPLEHAEHAEMDADAKELFVTAGQEILLPRMELEEFIATADLVYLTATRPKGRR